MTLARLQPWVLGFVLGLGLCLRLWDLDGRALWFDESMEAWVATAALSALPHSVRLGTQDPPLYALLLHLWMFFGTSEWHLRLLSVLLSMSGLAGMIVLTSRLAGMGSGLAAGFILALLPSDIRYAQEVGQYALMHGLLIWSLVAFWQARQNHDWRCYAGWIGLATLASYSYYGAVIAIVLPLVVEGLRNLWQRSWRELAALFLSAGLYCLTLIPLVWWFLPAQLFRGPTAEAFQIVWATPFAEGQAFLTATSELLAFLFLGRPWSVVPPEPLFALIGIGLLLAVFPDQRAPHMARWLGWLSLTWAGYYVLSRFGLFPYRFRYGLILLPLLLPVLAASLTRPFFRLRPNSTVRQVANHGFVLASWSLRSGLILPISAAGIVSLPNHAAHKYFHPSNNWGWPEDQHMGATYAYWQSQHQPAEPTYVFYGATPAFGYYHYLKSDQAHPMPATWYVGCWGVPQPSYCQTDGVYYGAWVRLQPVEQQIAAIEESFGTLPPTWWLVLGHPYRNEDQLLIEALLQRFTIGDSFVGRNSATYRFERRPQN